MITKVDPELSIWLEIRPCIDAAPSIQLNGSMIQKASALARLMSAAQQAKSGKKSLPWEYSLKVNEAEAQQVKDLIAFGDLSEDARSIVLSVAIGYCDSCYAVRLFFEKSQ